MPLDLKREGFVVTIGGAATIPFDSLRDALAELTDGYETRAVVFSLEGGVSRVTEDDSEWLESYPIPTIAALEGAVAAGAADLALACDIRVCGASATLSIPGIGGRRSLTLLGANALVSLIERGGTFDAESALEAGIVSSVVEDGGTLFAATALARVIAGRGPIATRFAKEAIWRGRALPLGHALRVETDLTVLLQSTKDRAEGVAAFLEKRIPAFAGN